MKRPFLPTIFLVCALIASFTVGYLFRDAQKPDTSLRKSSELGSMSPASTPRRVEIVRPLAPDEEDEAGDGRFRDSTPSHPSGAWVSSTNRRPSQDDSSRFGVTPVQPMLTVPQMRTAILPTFFVPVDAGRPRVVDKEKDKDGRKDEPQPDQDRTTSYAVLGSTGNDDDFATIKEILAGEEKEISVESVKTLREGIESNANVLILTLGNVSVPRLEKELVESFKERKVIGIGYGAAGVFEAAKLKLGQGSVAHGTRRLPPAIWTPENSLVTTNGTPIRIFERPPEGDDRFFNQSLFAYYLGPLKPERRKGVEVIARWPGDDDYAPIVRQRNAVLVGVNGQMASWSTEFRELIRSLALGLARR